MQDGIIYQGPSLIDGAPIVAVAIYTRNNKKTGAVVQTYILRSDMHPLEASRTGADVSICGACPLKGRATQDPKRKQAEDRGCYVILAQGPAAVWRALQRGVYAAVDETGLVALGAGRVVRLGSYGDPAAVPLHVWAALTREAASWTGYSHSVGLQKDLASFCMVSVESLEQARAQWAAGRRTFRVMSDASQLDRAREVLCPASEEAGKRTTCAACRLCSGTATLSPKSVAIVAHGAGKRYVAA